MTDPKSILDHHLESIAAGDVDEIVADYAEDAVVVTNMGNAEGLDAIRTMFSALPPGAFDGMENTAEEIGDDYGYVAWKTDAVAFGTDTFVLKDGKIVLQTVGMHFG